MLEQQQSSQITLLLTIWEEVFQVDQLDADADFFALGGDSLKAMRILSLVGHATGKTIPIRMLFDARTIKRFARILEEKHSLLPYIPIRSQRGLRFDLFSPSSLWIWLVLMTRDC